MNVEEMLKQTPLAVAIKLHTDTFGYPPEFEGRVQLGDPLIASEIHNSIAKKEPYMKESPREQQNEDGSITFIDW